MGWRLRRTTVRAMLVFALIIASGALILNWQNDWVAEKLARFATRRWLSERGFALSLEGFRWQLPDQLALDGLRVRYQGELRPAEQGAATPSAEHLFHRAGKIQIDHVESRLDQFPRRRRELVRHGTH